MRRGEAGAPDGAGMGGRAGRARVVGAAVAVALVATLLLGVPAPAGAQAPTCLGRSPTVADNGPGDRDPRPGYVLGTPGADVIAPSRALAIDGGDGDDVLCGDSPGLVVRGGAGNDAMACGFETTCEGGPGDDTLSCRSYAVCDGGEGKDGLAATEVGATLRGGAGDDRLRCACDRALLDGGAENDTIEDEGRGTVHILGGDGDDRIAAATSFVLPGLAARVDGGPGDDAITLRGASPPAADVGGTWLTVLGGPGKDTIDILGRYAGILVDGGDDDDRVAAGASAGAAPADYVVAGGAGDDELASGAGPHRLDGGPGRDRCRAEGAGGAAFASREDAAHAPRLVVSHSGGPLTFAPVADAYVSESSPHSSEMGSWGYLTVGASPARQAYLKFQLRGLGGRPSAAKLRLYALAEAPTGGAVARMTNSGWTEAATWHGKPAVDGTVVATLGPVTAARWYEVDITPAVAGDGSLSLALVPGAGAGAGTTAVACEA
jgi:Ca2+-binding RTX toxin-like protein